MYQLTEHEAFAALTLFVNEFLERAGDDLLLLVTDIAIEKDGITSDPAAWNDWMRCVRAVKEGSDSA
jgi:hypothetical protein